MTDTNTLKLRSDFIVVWLDTTIEKNRGNREIKALIRQLVRGQLLTFDDPDKCVDYITDQLLTKNISLITSNALGQNVIPFIYELPELQRVYIFCGNRQVAETWIKPEFKVSGIFTDKKALLHQICSDSDFYDKDNDLPMSVFHLAEYERTLQNLTQESATFMWYRAILVVIRQMANYYNSKDEMIAECRASYHGNEIEQKKIKNFEEQYSPKRAFWWYSSDSFVYRLLNKALRTQNIDIIFKFRFFINDLCNQIEQLYRRYLESHHSSMNQNLTAYRGQRLRIGELDLIKNNVNELISMNSFLSATLNKQVAMIFADTSDQANQASPLQSVLFIFDISNMSIEMTPFASIQHYACCPDEEEILFSIGAIFKVQSVTQQENMWHVHLQLSKEQNELSKNLSTYMMRQIGTHPNPLTFGWFLYRMNEFQKAERYANMIIEQLPPHDIGQGDAYNILGLINSDRNHQEKAVENFEKALEIYAKLKCENSPQVIAIRCSLGLSYLKLGDSGNAEDQQTEAERILINSSNVHTDLLRTKVDSLKAKLQAKNGEYIEALNRLEQVLENKRKALPSNHPSIGGTLNDIGSVQVKLGDYAKALESLQEALRIGMQTLPPSSYDLVEYYINIGRAHDRLEQYQPALENFEFALKILEEDERGQESQIEMVKEYIYETKKKLELSKNQ